MVIVWSVQLFIVSKWLLIFKLLSTTGWDENWGNMPVWSLCIARLKIFCVLGWFFFLIVFWRDNGEWRYQFQMQTKSNCSCNILYNCHYCGGKNVWYHWPFCPLPQTTSLVKEWPSCIRDPWKHRSSKGMKAGSAPGLGESVQRCGMERVLRACPWSVAWSNSIRVLDLNAELAAAYAELC